MTEPRDVPDSAIPREPIILPALCQRHLRAAVRRLGLGPLEAWRMAVVLANALMFRRVSARRRFQARCGGKVEDRGVSTINLVLAEIGCLACWDQSSFTAAIACLRRPDPYAADVIHGRVVDPDFPLDGSEPVDA